MKHRHRDQPVTRREVLRIVQRARDDIISAVVHASEPLNDAEVADYVTRFYRLTGGGGGTAVRGATDYTYPGTINGGTAR